MNRTLAALAVVVVVVVAAVAAYALYDGGSDNDGGSIVYSDGLGPEERTGIGDGTVAECMFERDGYAFTGWNTQRDGTGVTYVPDDYIEIGEGTLVLYAQWSPVMGETVWSPNANELLGDVMILTGDGETVADGGTVVPFGTHTFVIDAGNIRWQETDDGTIVASTSKGTFSVELVFVGSVIPEGSGIGEDGNPMWTADVGGPFSINVICQEI